MVKCRVNWGALPEGSAVSVFRVINTAFNSLYVMAQDEKSAMSIAWAANHVHGAAEIHEDHYFRAAHKADPSEDKNLQQFVNAIQLAMERRLQGSLHFESGQLALGDELISE